MPTRRTFLSGAAAGLVAPLPLLSVRVHRLSRRPRRVVVPFPAGGSTDALARIMAEKLKGGYAPATIVENRVGAAGRLAVEYVKNAEADGSVMLFTPDFLMTVYPHSFRSLNYDPVRDFTPVATVAKSALCINVGPAVPAEVKTLADFVQWCKANPEDCDLRDNGRRRHAAFCRPDVVAGLEGRDDAGPLQGRRAGLAGYDRRSCLVERQSGERSAAICESRQHPHAGGDQRQALGLPAGRADHEGSRATMW